MSIKVLCVDDDANILAAFQRNLRKQFSIDIALGPELGLSALDERGPYAVVVADMRMPGMDGIEFLTAVQKKAPDTVRIMLTGNADQKTAMDAVNHGQVFRFLTKPCESEELSLALTAGLKQYRLVTAERELLERTLNGSIKTMSEILSVMDPQSFGMGKKLRDHIRLFAQFLKLKETWELELAAMLSQIGCVTIPPAVLNKARAEHGLSGDEKDMLERIPQIGSSLLINIPRLESVANIILYQNKNYDGSGFPVDSIVGEEIPIGSRILRILAEIYIMEMKGLPRFKALAKLRQFPSLYDSKVLESIAAAFDIYLDAKAGDENTIQSVTFKELRIGQVLRSPLLTLDGTLIVPVGAEITQVVMEKIQNFAELSGLKEPIEVNG